ncbi:MAG: class I SAM-dependent methyltransferase [Cyanobacteria bacterium J06632_22]
MNKFLQYVDLARVSESEYFSSLRDFIDRLSSENIACTTRGSLKSTNLTDSTKWYRYTMHYMRAWEYVRLLDILDIPEGASVLDVGGAGTPLTFYLAAIKKCQVTTVDLQPELVEHTNAVARQQGWPLQAVCQDFTQYTTDQSFDYAVSLSVIEHMRDEVKAKTTEKMGQLLKPGGKICITFDFGQTTVYEGNASGEVYCQLTSIDAIRDWMIQPSQCDLMGDFGFSRASSDEAVTVRNTFRDLPVIPYFPPDFAPLRQLLYKPLGYTYGSLFMVKPEA